MDDQTGAFFQPMDDAPAAEEPIILGAPMDDFAGGGDYLGEIDAAPPAVLIPEEPLSFAAPVIVAPGVEEVDDEDDYEEPVAASEPSPMAVWNDSWQVTLKERKDEENAQRDPLLRRPNQSCPSLLLSVMPSVKPACRLIELMNKISLRL
eukprot:648615_1